MTEGCGYEHIKTDHQFSQKEISTTTEGTHSTNTMENITISISTVSNSTCKINIPLNITCTHQ